ncbi:hypothetical protein CGMCC3_g17999 [Colletotrichum fructicola]|uniref:Uncharacterized protein n=2 Tax=Colletotrichum fructicola (strain Nara gc5) TaxID=1213859 RepID=A0A7J6ILW0_COLFN|nr:uncharacterized protein CGMCC3_g17999 [Colletotrichum fructicola]KAE9565819.1 hypothetical protein CGMCC3_g17999 [Colletotrichum fructicola]KAF4417273.1 hypothetical protein CFRS1_v015960 [Colletotrichum fructicola]KAF4477502.1 hypothetical protein CGGC5_v014267 [Colletotrichum fructicola Nara gc5]
MNEGPATVDDLIAKGRGYQMLQLYEPHAPATNDDVQLDLHEWAALYCDLKKSTSATLTDTVNILVLCGTLICKENTLVDFNLQKLLELVHSRAMTPQLSAPWENQLKSLLRAMVASAADESEPRDGYGIDRSIPFIDNLQTCGKLLGIDWHQGRFTVDDDVLEMLRQTAGFRTVQHDTESLSAYCDKLWSKCHVYFLDSQRESRGFLQGWHGG